MSANNKMKTAQRARVWMVLSIFSLLPKSNATYFLWLFPDNRSPARAAKFKRRFDCQSFVIGSGFDPNWLIGLRSGNRSGDRSEWMEERISFQPRVVCIDVYSSGSDKNAAT